MKKLSEQFLEMSQRAAVLENRTAAIQQENRKDFEENVVAPIAANLDKEEAALAAQMRELDEAFAAYVTPLQRRMDEAANARDLASARAHADEAETYAEIVAEFAHLMATEAENAKVEARKARAAALSIEQALS